MITQQQALAILDDFKWAWEMAKPPHRADIETLRQYIEQGAGAQPGADGLALLAEQARTEPHNLAQECAKARRHGFLDALSSGTARELCALLRSGVKQLEAWHAKYGEHQPQWLPPAGDVRWMEDVAAALDGRAAPPLPHKAEDAPSDAELRSEIFSLLNADPPLKAEQAKDAAEDAELPPLLREEGMNWCESEHHEYPGEGADAYVEGYRAAIRAARAAERSA